jgi:hypothetical protein
MRSRDGNVVFGVEFGAEQPAAAGGQTDGPFGSIEASHRYVAELLQVVEETAAGVGEDLRRTRGGGGRRREALQIVAYKLGQLSFHLAVSRRRLGELRALRLIVDGEGPEAREAGTRKGEAA